MKKIKKVAVTELDPITGSIVDGTNIDDKTVNTYSANTIDGLLSENSDSILSQAISFGGPTSETDANNITTSGVYYVGNIDNLPSSKSGYGGVMLVFKPAINSKTIVQIFFDGKGELVASRMYWYDTVGWLAWKAL